MKRIALVALSTLILCATYAGADGHPVLIENVRIFDGVSAELQSGSVLVQDGKIAGVSSGAIDAPEGAEVVDGGGRILSPGFIDIHAHLTFQVPRDLFLAHPWVAGAVAGDAAEAYLMYGFTTIRDAGGTHPDFARAIDSGLLVGPRVFPSGAVVSQTSGHGDFRLPNAAHPHLGGGDRYLMGGASVLADGVSETLAAVRENLKHGATQIKIMGGGGVASDYDPIHTLQPSPAEIRAAVQAASDWGTYVLAHAYTAEAIQRLVENGVKVIEHGLLIDEETAKMCAEKGIVISTQVRLFNTVVDVPGMSEENKRKAREVRAGQDNLLALIKKYDIKTGFGTDFVFGSYHRVPEEWAARALYFDNAEILRQATSESAEIIRMAGKLNRHGNFGEVREGWLADLVLIDGDPFEDISILGNPDEALPLIMKAGKIYKNEL